MLARGFDQQESESCARFAAVSAQHEVETHGARKMLHLLDHEFRRSRSCVPSVKHDVLVRLGAVEVWDANCKLGPAVAYLAQERATLLSKEQGAGVVLVRNTNHYGWGGAYALDFMRDGVVSGNLCQGAIPIVTPIGGIEARMGCNAVSIAMETYAESCPIMLWDAGIGASSWGEVQQRKLDGLPLREGCVVDADGEITLDAQKAASLLPAGSLGNALGILVELLTAQIGAGDPRQRSAASQIGATNPEPVTCSFVHFALNTKSFDSIAFPDGRTRAENVEAMVNSLLQGNGNARLSGLRKWRAKQRSQELGGLLFSAESIEAFQCESKSSGISLPTDIHEVAIEFREVDVASK